MPLDILTRMYKANPASICSYVGAIITLYSYTYVSTLYLRVEKYDVFYAITFNLVIPCASLLASCDKKLFLEEKKPRVAST